MLPFTTKPEQFRAVFDTNIIMAAHLTKNPRSPTRELLERWRMEEFELMVCIFYTKFAEMLDNMHRKEIRQ